MVIYMLSHVLTGGFLKNYRTYLLGFLVAATGVIKYLTGDESLSQLVNDLPAILGGLGLVTLRAGLANHMALVQEALAAVKVVAGMQQPPQK
jgi:hypothetical protein